MSFLDTILATKRTEAAALRQQPGAFDVTASRETRSLRAALTTGTKLAVISEIKRKSPSKGVIQATVDPVARARVYAQAGAAAISVLTDKAYFGGSINDLKQVREVVSVPVLRKDFIIDELQIDEAYAAGADAILLIAAALPARRLSELSAYAKHLGLEVLLEVHGVDELDAALAAAPSVLGINNRNLHTFEVDLKTTEAVIAALPQEMAVVAESGVFGRSDAARMAAAGARAVLVGELLMRHADLQEVAHCLTELQVPLTAVAAQ